MFINQLVSPVLYKGLLDPDAKVRFFAFEAMYNLCIACRSLVGYHFEDLFCSLCIVIFTHYISLFLKFQASCDPDVIVREASELLNRLIKDITRELFVFDIPNIIQLIKSRLKAKNPLALKVRKKICMN